MHYFISDLDKTLIYSNKKLHKCVEYIDDRQITFMTYRSYDLIIELMKKAVFVPCTMRNFNQTMRIGFIKKYNPKYLICTNGSQIYINGELDKEWDNYMNSLIDKEEIVKISKEIDSNNLNLKENINIEGFYITLKFYTEEEAKSSLDKVKHIAGDKYLVSNLGVKVFIIDKKIDKAFAVEYLRDKYNFTNIHTAGDSVYDEKFTSLDYVHNYVPRHAEFKHENSFVSRHIGIRACEEILEAIMIRIGAMEKWL